MCSSLLTYFGVFCERDRPRPIGAIQSESHAVHGFQAD